MPRKIKIQTVDKTNLTNLENTLNETLCKKHVTISGPEKTIVVSNDTTPCSVEEFKAQLEREREDRKEIRKTIDNSKNAVKRYQEITCIENTGDAIASTNDDNSTVVNIQDIKLKKLIDKFNDIILDITTDDFTDNMSINEKNIKYSRQKGIILEEDFQNFLDVINIEKFNEITDIPEDISKLTVKLHGNKEYLNNNNVFLELTGYYNFLINKLFIPIENITENSYLFKLADKYISNYNKFEFNIPNDVIDNFAESASTSYKEIINNIDKLNNSVDALIARQNVNIDNGIYSTDEKKCKPANPKAKDLIKAKEIVKALREKDVTSTKELMEKVLSNNTNQPGEFVISIPQDYETTMEENNNTECNTHYEEVNHPNHYNVYDVEVVEMMERIFGVEETMSWCKLNAFKYRMRAGEKPTSTVEKDLKKEKWCLNKYHELKTKL